MTGRVFDVLSRGFIGLVVGAALGSAIFTAYAVTQRGVACYSPALDMRHIYPAPEQDA